MKERLFPPPEVPKETMHDANLVISWGAPGIEREDEFVVSSIVNYFDELSQLPVGKGFL